VLARVSSLLRFSARPPFGTVSFDCLTSYYPRMVPGNPGSALRFASWIPVVLVAFFLGACGHTEAAPPAVPANVVMQTIRDYGRGHEGTPAPAPPGLPDTSDASYRLNIQHLLDQENYTEVGRVTGT
jgi:hypothetical protein